MNKVIYSSDENALEKLRQRLQTQKEKHEEMKRQNKYFREHCTMKDYPGMKDDTAAIIDDAIEHGYSWCKAPYPQYAIQNSNQRIKATEMRIKELEQEQSREEAEYDTEGLGFEVVENKDISRLQIIYGHRVDGDTYKSLRQYGFVFSHTNNAFQRQLNERARWAAGRFIAEQRALQKERVTGAEM